MESLIRKALDKCGYTEEEANEGNLIECFLEYCDCGQFGNLDVETAKEEIEEGEITVSQMCSNLLRLK